MNAELSRVRRVFVEKKSEYAVEADNLLADLQRNLGLQDLTGLRILNRYDLTGVTDAEYAAACTVVFSEPPVDMLYHENAPLDDADFVMAIEALPGQFDQRADSAAQCVQLLTGQEKPAVQTAKVYVFTGSLTDENQAAVKKYLINPVELREASFEKPETLTKEIVQPADIEYFNGFTEMNEVQLQELSVELGLAMSTADICFIRDWFAAEEQRDPSITEIRVLDTYWSDHCRHTTFLTHLKEVGISGEGAFADRLSASYNRYLELREHVHNDRLTEKPVCLMDLGTIAMKELRRLGLLENLDDSEEINACSIKVQIEVDGREEDYLVMFKNETHNHPTEIEPFGGAATCLGGAIRDPLSGRSYVYQAMRVTGAGDPTEPLARTLPGKLPQRKISTGAAAGYSSYGNQIGLATGLVKEFFHPGYVAKRMEIGAVVAAAPADQVIRERPKPGDLVILVGGRTGRDGLGGATGSSKVHDESSVATGGSEVQKGNPPTERKLQRLFRNPLAARMIKRCNDFGAGGVSVAVGELADSLEINLDAVPLKYLGLDGTEIAISESQERMAVVVRPDQAQAFIRFADEENLEATIVAKVTDTGRMVMKWRGAEIVDLSRRFIATNGAPQEAIARVQVADLSENLYFAPRYTNAANFAERMKEALGDLRNAAQKGLAERFDSTIGAGTVLLPYGGYLQLTPEEGMVAKIPVLKGQTEAVTLMTYGFDPDLSSWSPYHGAYYAVLQSLARGTALGGSPQRLNLTFQEYFPRTDSPENWGVPVASLLGALDAQLDFGVAAIGGKDSMSGNFEDLKVPPTLVSFAVGTRRSGDIHSAALSATDSALYYIPVPKDELYLPIATKALTALRVVHNLQKEKRVAVTATVDGAGPAVRALQMCFGNGLGFSFNEELDEDLLFTPDPAGVIVEVPQERLGGSTIKRLQDVGAILLGRPSSVPLYSYKGSALTFEEALQTWLAPLEPVFPLGFELNLSNQNQVPEPPTLSAEPTVKPAKSASVISGKPTVLIPVFPGTNCEYDTAAAFRLAGGKPELLVVRNLTANAIAETVNALEKAIRQAQILVFPGGFSAGDEPEGSGKFIAAMFRNPKLTEAVRELLFKRDGLMLGICNGFQALIKLGLLPFGDITEADPEQPTLTFNTIGRHISYYARTRIVSNRSPWLSATEVGEIYNVPLSHGEGRFVANAASLETMRNQDQIAVQYVDANGKAATELPANPNGSVWAIEAVTSPDGRILGKMGHSERYAPDIAQNIPGNKDQKLFASGINYFKL